MSTSRFITYAQNGEDVLLWRALGHIPNGFYIDVGANDPELHSVTKAFYDAGWHGINVEPMPSYHAVFQTQRPRDINLAVACGAEEASITLFDVPSVNGWASTDAGVAQAHRAEGYTVAEVQVPLRTLSGICAEHVQGDIHFLKIDVEGFEGEVLRGMDFQRWRPWVLAIEATLPNSRVTNHEQWEALVTSQNYQFAYFDGLNRYYVAAEHAELLAALTVQPNVFDDYLPAALVQAWHGMELAQERSAAAEQRAWDAQARQEDAEQRSAAAEAEAANLRAHAEALEHARAAAVERAVAAEDAAARADAWGRDLEHRLTAVYASSAWRITWPLRLVGGTARRVKRAVQTRLRARLVRLSTVPWLRRLLLPMIAKVPGLDHAVTDMLARARHVPTPEADAARRQLAVAPELRDLNAASRQAYAALRQARHTEK